MSPIRRYQLPIRGSKKRLSVASILKSSGRGQIMYIWTSLPHKFCKKKKDKRICVCVSVFRRYLVRLLPSTWSLIPSKTTDSDLLNQQFFVYHLYVPTTSPSKTSSNSMQFTSYLRTIHLSMVQQRIWISNPAAEDVLFFAFCRCTVSSLDCEIWLLRCLPSGGSCESPYEKFGRRAPHTTTFDFSDTMPQVMLMTTCNTYNGLTTPIHSNLFSGLIQICQHAFPQMNALATLIALGDFWGLPPPSRTIATMGPHLPLWDRQA